MMELFHGKANAFIAYRRAAAGGSGIERPSQTA
jgi:hypothetical protein